MFSISFHTPSIGKYETNIIDFCAAFIINYIIQVLFDFAERYKDTDANGFTDKWMAYADRLCVTMREFYRNQNYTDWQDDIDRILLLLAAFPFKLNGRRNNSNPVLSFKKAVNKLIVFRKVVIKYKHFHWRCKLKVTLSKFPAWNDQRGTDPKRQFTSVHNCLWRIENGYIIFLHRS